MTWVKQVLREFEGRVLTFSDTTALICAPLHVPDKKSFRDSMIAATRWNMALRWSRAT
jgi:toxin FitB